MKRKIFYNEEYKKPKIPKNFNDIEDNFRTLAIQHLADSLDDNSMLFLGTNNGKPLIKFLTEIGNASVVFSETIEDAAREFCDDDPDADVMAAMIHAFRKALKILEKHESQYSDSLIK